MDLKLSDQYVSEFEKNKIREMRHFQQRNLESAQAELEGAQRTVVTPQDVACPLVRHSILPLDGSKDFFKDASHQVPSFNYIDWVHKRPRQ